MTVRIKKYLKFNTDKINKNIYLSAKMNLKYYLVQPRHIEAILAAVLATRPALTTLLVDCKENCDCSVGNSAFGTFNITKTLFNKLKIS